MKNILFLVFLCGFLGAKAQELKQMPEKHTNYLLVNTSLSMPDAMRAIGRALVKEGYMIESTDAMLQTITTKRAVDGGLIKYNCQVFAEFDEKPAGVDVKLYARQDAIDNYEQWLPLYTGFKKTWEKLEAVAASLDGVVMYGEDEKR
jgi:hypothetical protein